MVSFASLFHVSLALGAFGEVRMCVHRDTGAQRAVKVLRKAHMDEDEKKMLFNEINILRNLVSLTLLLSFLHFCLGTHNVPSPSGTVTPNSYFISIY